MNINLKSWRADEARTAEAIVGMHFVSGSGVLGKLLLARMMPNFKLFPIVLERAGFAAAVLFPSRLLRRDSGLDPPFFTGGQDGIRCSWLVIGFFIMLHLDASDQN